MSQSSVPDGPGIDRLSTKQLSLRPVENRDASAIAAYLSEWNIVKQTVSLPFPYDERSALTWIARVRRRHVAGTQYAFAITRHEEDAIVGAVAMSLFESPTGKFGEIGYWLGMPHWGQGFASEAVAAVTALGLVTLSLSRIEAILFDDNVNSRRVLEKCGYKLERGETRRYPDRGGRRKVLIYAIRPDQE